MVGACVCAWLLQSASIRSAGRYNFNKEVNHNPCNAARTLTNGGRYARNLNLLSVSVVKWEVLK